MSDETTNPEQPEQPGQFPDGARVARHIVVDSSDIPDRTILAGTLVADLPETVQAMLNPTQVTTEPVENSDHVGSESGAVMYEVPGTGWDTPPQPEERELADLTKKELQARAEVEGAGWTESMTKAELVAAIEAVSG